MAFLAKICILGDGQVGKTSLVNSYTGEGFFHGYLPTLGTEFVIKQISLETKYGRNEIRFQIWDLAGQPAFKQIRSAYYKGAVGALLVFDITRPESLENLIYWCEEYSNNTGLTSASLIVIGNKMDLMDHRKVPSNIAKEFISENLNGLPNFDEKIEYFETSAKTGKNVEKAFEVVGKMILNKI